MATARVATNPRAAVGVWLRRRAGNFRHERKPYATEKLIQ